MPMEVGDEFVDFKAFNAAMPDWSITGEHNLTFRDQKSDEAREIVVCAHADYFFRLYVAMPDWSITGEHNFTFRDQKSDKARNIVVCAHADYSFRVYAAMDKDRGTVEVITANPNHICVGAVMQPRSTANRQAWLQRIVPATLSDTKKTTPSQIIDDVKFHHKVPITNAPELWAKLVSLECGMGTTHRTSLSH